MRFKKGFTLAEILIVLMVIGAIATMTVPSMMKGVTEAQWKTAYKKAYNTVLNVAAIERVSGYISADKNAFYTVLKNNLSKQGYATMKTNFTNDGAYDVDSIKTSDLGLATTGENATTPWIIADDGIAYYVVDKGDCKTKADVVSATTLETAKKAACIVVGVDANGLLKGPNKIEPEANKELTKGTAMQAFTGERFYIYVANDGVTAGNAEKLATGRIINDIK